MRIRDDPGFGDDGQIVPAVDFDYPESPGGDDDLARCRMETINRVLQHLTSGGRNATAVGRKAILLAFAINRDGRQKDVARRLGISEAAVSLALKSIRAEWRWKSRNS